MTQAICDITTDEVNVDVVVEPQADTMVEVANRAGGMEQVFHDNTLIGNGNSVDLGVNTDIIATKEYSDEQDTLLRNEINGKLTAIDSQIDANADAIQKTREDFASADQSIRADMNAKDSELETILNDHAERLNTLRTDHDDLGDDVSDIQAKIPESASGSNPLITKQQLLEEEMDIREDLNSGLSELQTQITHQAAAIAGKQDELIAGDNIIISGNIISAAGAGGGVGFDVIVVQELPESGEKGIIYLVPKDGAAPDIYDEYVWVTTTSTFELIGSTKVDLTNYVKNTDYASDTAGVIKVSTVYGIRAGTSNNGYLVGVALPLDNYTDDKIIISKGTLENIKEDLVARATANAVNTENLTVGSDEGALYMGVVAGTATIATNNGLDIAAQTKFDTAPTTDDTTAWADANPTALVTKQQVVSAISEGGGASGDYLPLSGGTLTGQVSIDIGETSGYSWTDYPVLLFNWTNPDAWADYTDTGFYATANGLAFGKKSVGVPLITFDASNKIIYPGVVYNESIDSGINIGGRYNKFRSIAVAKINTGENTETFEETFIEIPKSKVGTMATIEDIAAIGGEGTTGQVLTKTDDGFAWQDSAGGGDDDIDCGVMS